MSTSERPEFDPLAPPQNPLEKLINGSIGPLSRLRDSIDLTLDEVSQWIAHPENRRQINNLVTLLDAQTQLIICQHRLIAVARLADVASSQASPETVRRACADLLKLRLIDPYKEDKRPEKMPPPRPVNDEKFLEMLEQMGKQWKEEDMRIMNGGGGGAAQSHSVDVDGDGDRWDGNRQDGNIPRW